ncbi:L,D-transpeptidase family protein [Hansschlegelia zhihuaiae]|uniref:L,D-transpeptidase family protein n=1 Tax=Hansschlegelia zhihuaiae TaxID=405005 RepID=UPI0019D46880
MSTASPRRSLFGLSGLLLIAIALAGCSSAGGGGKRQVKTGSVTVATVGLMRDHDMERSAPILMRIFKEEAVLEVWKQDRSGRYQKLRTYPICKFSGKLGPKIREGDRQAPEGFYTISPKSLNPFSRNHLAFNIGFPNAYDRSLGRTGSHLMVHGGCNSVGCYAMTHKRIEEIYGLTREAMQGGQQVILFQAFPFRMTEENMARHADNPNYAFWRDLKHGHDIFEATGEPPRVFACDGRYAFAPAGQPGDVCAMAQGAPPPLEAPLASLGGGAY